MLDRVLAIRGPVVVYQGRTIFDLGATGQHEHACLIKVLRRRESEDEDVMMRFVREAVLGYELTHVHPNLVTTRDFGVLPDGRPFLVTDFEPVTLDRIRDAIRGDLPVVRVVAHAVLSALVYLHHQGLAHRGVAETNIHVSWDGAVMLGDLSGLAMSQRYVGEAPGVPDPLLDTARRHDLRELGHVLQGLITGAVTQDSEEACRSLPDILPQDLRSLVTQLLRPESDPPGEPYTAEKAFVQLRTSRELFASREHLAVVLQEEGERLQREAELGRAVQVDQDDDEEGPDELAEEDRERVTAAIRSVLMRLEQGETRGQPGGSSDDVGGDASSERSEADTSETALSIGREPAATAAAIEPPDRGTRTGTSRAHRPRRRRMGTGQSPLAFLLASLLGGLGAGAAGASVLVLVSELGPSAGPPAAARVAVQGPLPHVPDTSRAHRASGSNENSQLAGVAGGQQIHGGSELGASSSYSNESPTRGGAMVQSQSIPGAGEDEVVLLVDENVGRGGKRKDVQLWIVNRGHTEYDAQNLTLLDENQRPARVGVAEFQQLTASTQNELTAQSEHENSRKIPPGRVARAVLHLDSGELMGESFTVLVSEAGGRRPAAITSRVRTR